MATEERTVDSGLIFLAWAGDSHQTTDERVAAREFADALRHFQDRLGQPASIVWVSLTSPITSYPGVTVERVRTVQAGHIWPGIAERALHAPPVVAVDAAVAQAAPDDPAAPAAPTRGKGPR